MPTRQGDLSLLQHPVAQELLSSKIPARLVTSPPMAHLACCPSGFIGMAES